MSEMVICPTCGKPTDKDTVEQLGECLGCDHVRGDVDYCEEDYEENDED